MRKLLFALLCLGLICISCSKDEEKEEKEYNEGIEVEKEEKPVLPMDTISYKNQISYGCSSIFIENSTYIIQFKTDFDYEIVIEPTQHLSWESIRRAVNTKANILEYNSKIGTSPLIQKISIQNVSHNWFEKIEIFDLNNYLRYNLRNSKAYIDFAYKDYDSIDPENKNQYIRLFRLVFEGEDITIKVLLNYRGS